MKTSLIIGIIMSIILSFGFKNDDTGTNMTTGTGILITDWVAVPACAYTYGQGDTAKTIAYEYSVMKYEATMHNTFNICRKHLLRERSQSPAHRCRDSIPGMLSGRGELTHFMDWGALPTAHTNAGKSTTRGALFN